MSAHLPSYEARFDQLGWYLVRSVARLKRTLGSESPTLVDLGTGRGRDIIYLARRGFRVLGVDISPEGLEKANRRAVRLDLPIRTQLRDIRTFRLKGTFDVVFSNCTLNNLPPERRAERFAHYQRATARGGIHAVNAFVPNSSVGPLPDREPNETVYRPGELRGYYRDWDVLDSREVEFACNYRGGVPHRHSLELVVARKPGRSPPTNP